MDKNVLDVTGKVAELIRAVPGIVAAVLGGSRAQGTETVKSDIDTANTRIE